MGFKLNSTLVVKGSIAAEDPIRLAPNDYCGGIAHQIDVYFCYFLGGHLDEEKFIAATQQLLYSFPALGASLDLQAIPCLDIRNTKIPVSFASWPGGSVQQLSGGPNAGKQLPSEIILCDKIQINGEDSLFKLRATALGDGNTLLAASWLHILGDGSSISKCMQLLATAYRSLCRNESGPLPSPEPGRPFWPWHLKNSSSQADTQSIEHEDQELLDIAAALFKSDDQKLQSGTAVKEPNSRADSAVNVRISKADLARLKSVALDHAVGQQIEYLSTNDIVMGLAWMLNNEAKNKVRPGQGPAGSCSTAVMGIDLARNGLPDNLQRISSLANLSKATTFTAESNGLLNHDPDDDSALLLSLASAAVAIRKGILQVRKIGAIQLLLESSDQLKGSEKAPQQIPDTVMTNWAGLGHKEVDFGNGVLGFYGYFGYKPSPVIVLPDGENKIIHISCLARNEAHTILSSAVLKLLLSTDSSAFLLP